MNNEDIKKTFGVPRQEWSAKNHTFNVQVVQHHRDVSATREAFSAYGLPQDDLGWRWNVYAFIFPVHPLFKEFDAASDSFHQPVCQAMPFHCGPSYIRRHFDHLGNVSCIQVGSDYNHLGDGRFEMAETVDDARQVFRDAQALIDYLKYAEKPRHEG